MTGKDQQFNRCRYGNVLANPCWHNQTPSLGSARHTAKNVQKLVQDFKQRTGGRIMNSITSDEYRPYKKAILEAYGRKVAPPRTARRGRCKGAHRIPPLQLKYAAVHKTRRKDRVIKIDLCVVFGAKAEAAAAIEASAVGSTINAAFVERHNGTDRKRNARKVRKSYCFSKDWHIHNAMTYFRMYSYDFRGLVRTLPVQGSNGRRLPRTPAMVAGLADHVLSPAEWLTFAAFQ